MQHTAENLGEDCTEDAPDSGRDSGRCGWEWDLVSDQLLFSPQFTAMLGYDTGEEPDNKLTDRRFRHAGWSEQPAFNAIKDSYLMLANHVQRLVSETEGLDDQTAAVGVKMLLLEPDNSK